MRSVWTKEQNKFRYAIGLNFKLELIHNFNTQYVFNSFKFYKSMSNFYFSSSSMFLLSQQLLNHFIQFCHFFYFIESKWTSFGYNVIGIMFFPSFSLSGVFVFISMKKKGISFPFLCRISQILKINSSVEWVESRRSEFEITI